MQSEVNCIWNIFHFKSYTNANLKIQCFIDILSKWKIKKFFLNFLKMYTLVFFLILNSFEQIFKKTIVT
jgi:hypothetical protein